MKKVLALAMTALMAFSAQALTAGWYNATVAADATTSTNYNVSGIDSRVDKILITATLTVNDTSSMNASAWNNAFAGSANNNTATAQPILAYAAPTGGSTTGKDRHYNGLIAFSNIAIGTLLHNGTGKTWGQQINDSITDGTYDISLLFTRTDTGWTVNNGDVSWTSSGENGTTTSPNPNANSISDAQFGFNDGAFTLYTSTAEELAVSNVAVTYSLPEPTALALLALGVAGVALRRKVK